MLSKSLEEYVKEMYILKMNKGEIRVTDIANSLQVSKASVNKAIKQLSTEDVVDYETYGEIKLTLEGERIAKKILEAYDITYLFLNEILQVDPKLAESEAKEMKNIMSDDTLNKLAKYTHEKLGLASLECGYDIDNEKCISCLRRKVNK
ncbi:MAG: metal-dependent transcriptional regulator [Clostridiales bacterium]|nr:metal-dependent transcriptional regulator [Clostridiales bacterium]